MVPIKGEWMPFADLKDQVNHFRQWGLISPKSSKLRPIMVTDGYFGKPEPCKVVGYQSDSWAVIELSDGYHAIHGEYLAELQPIANQKLPHGVCFAEILSNYIVLDIETTGFDFKNDRILEIAAISYEYGNKTGEYHTLVNPGMLLPPEIVSLTGISQSDVDAAPILEDIEENFLHFIGDTPIVGHNALSFDVPFLSAQLSRPIENTTIDTLPMARKVFDLLPRHKLEYLNSVLRLADSISHRAYYDVETTNALLWACLSPRKYESRVYQTYLNSRINVSSAVSQKRGSKKEKSAPSKKRFEHIDIKAIRPTCDCSTLSGPLCGKTIVFTGSLALSREEAMQLAVDSGAVLKTAVSGQTDYLVVGKQDISLVGFGGISTKEAKAMDLNKSGKAHIKIISEEEFLQLVTKEGQST